jgi:two-component system nitrate/nitrite response regulator NarL
MDGEESRGHDQDPSPIQVVVVDKNPLLLSGLRQIFDADPRFSLVATASDGERFLEAVERLRFDVGVIGWEMPYLGGQAVLSALKTRRNAPRIVVYTGRIDAAVPRLVMALGGAGFCLKSDPPARLLDTVAAVAAGNMVFPFVDMRALMDNPLLSLTARERELLKALASGRTNAQLATAMGVSVNTIKFHLRNLYDKLSVRNRAQAVALHMSTDGDSLSQESPARSGR